MDITQSKPTYSAELTMIKGSAKADGMDAVLAEVTLINTKTNRPTSNFPIQILIDGESLNTDYSVECPNTDLAGKATCTITSTTFSKVLLQVDLGTSASSAYGVEETLNASSATFFDINSSARETSPGSGTSYASTPLGEALLTVISRTTENEPVIGMTPQLSVTGPGTVASICTPTDVNGESICSFTADIAGDYSVEVAFPRLEHPIPIRFLANARSCTIAHAQAQEIWGDGAASWGACRITSCNINYTRTSDTTCVANHRYCVPMPVGAGNAEQLWEESTAGAWGACVITACKENYSLSGPGGGNSCIAATRAAPPEVLPEHATSGEQTWDGSDWSPVVVTACEYPYKPAGPVCSMLDITPDAFVLLDKYNQPLDTVIYSDAILIGGVEDVIQTSLSGDSTALMERRPQGGADWIPFDADTETLKNGDTIRFGVTSGNNISVTTSIVYILGATGPLEWKVTTRASLPPSDIVVEHQPNEKTFSIEWATGGMGNSAGLCQLQIRKNAGTWTDVGAAVDCDVPLAPVSLQLPAAVGFSQDFNATGIPLRLVRMPGAVLVADLPDKLTCVPDPNQPTFDDPGRDENCNTNWIDDADSNPPVGGSFTIAQSSPVANPLITLNIVCATDAEGPVDVAYGETNPPTNFEACASTKSLNLSAGTGTKTVYVQFADAVGNTLPVQSQTIFLDQTVPAGGSLEINGGALYTKNAATTLTLTCPLDNGQPTKIALSESPNPGDPANVGDWQTCTTSLPWNLSAGDGQKTIYLRYMDTAGNVSTDVSAAIIYDTAPPASTVAYLDGWQNSSSIHIDITQSDTTSAVDSCHLQVAEASINSGTVAAFGGWSTVASTCGDQVYSGANNLAYQFRYTTTDKAGNTSTSTSAAITKVDLSPPTGGSFTFAEASPVYLPGVTLNIDCASDNNGSVRVAFGENSTPINWQTCAASKSFTLSSGTATKTVYMRFMDDFGNISAATSQNIDLDQDPRGSGEVLINAGASYTTAPVVSLMVDCLIENSVPMKMAIGDAVNPGDELVPGDWQVCNPNVPFGYTLPAGNGTKTVYVRFLDASMNPTANSTDSILLDSVAPLAAVTYANTWQTTTSISVTVSQSDADSGISSCHLQKAEATLSNGLAGAFDAWTSVSTSCSDYTMTGVNGKAYKFRYQVSDRAGNLSDWSNPGHQIKIDSQAPAGGSFTIATASPTGSPAISLNIVCATDSQGATQVAFGESAAPTNWQACSGTKAMTLSSGSGTKSVYLRFSDNQGNISSTLSSSIYLDQTAPTGGSVTINNADAYTNSTASTLTLVCPLDNGTATKVAIGTTTNPGNPAVPGDWQPCATSIPWTLTAGVGTKTVYVRYMDSVGNVSSSYSDNISYDNVLPTASISYPNAWQTSTAFTVAATHADANSGLASCELQLAQASITNGTVGAFGSFTKVSGTCGNYSTTGVSGKAYKFQYRSVDNAGNVSVWSAPASILKIDTTVPSGGSISYLNSIQTGTSFTLTVNRGNDADSGMSTVNTDYVVQVAYATLNTSTLACGTYSAFADAGLAETATATSYNYTGAQGRCYQFRYLVKNAVGLTTTYTSPSVAKINYTYSWNIGTFGACSGGTGSWSYGTWGGCSGGSGSWAYGGWSSCSKSCGGGTQSRSATCNRNANSGSQSRSATCNKTTNSGSQTRTVQCRRSDNVTVADSFCSGPKAATSQACTPTSNSVCGTAKTSQACTPTTDAVCGTKGATSQSCNTQACCTAANNTTNMCAGYTAKAAYGGSPPSPTVIKATYCASKQGNVSCGPTCPPTMCAPTWHCNITCY